LRGLKSNWRRGNKEADKLARKMGFRYGGIARQVAGVGAALWMGLIVLGIFPPTEQIWTFATGIIGSFILVEYVIDGFLKIEDGRAFTPFSKRPVAAWKAYVIFIALIIASAVIAENFSTEVLQTSQSLLGHLLTVAVWSIVLSGLLSTILLRQFRRTITLQIGHRQESKLQSEEAHVQDRKEP
jgi:hypothetical protein